MTLHHLAKTGTLFFIVCFTSLSYGQVNFFGFFRGGKANGVCGSADGVPTWSAPTTGLCSSGTSSALSVRANNTGWTWTCAGKDGGTSANCGAQTYLYKRTFTGKMHNSNCEAWAASTYTAYYATLADCQNYGATGIGAMSNPTQPNYSACSGTTSPQCGFVNHTCTYAGGQYVAGWCLPAPGGSCTDTPGQTCSGGWFASCTLEKYNASECIQITADQSW